MSTAAPEPQYPGHPQAAGEPKKKKGLIAAIVGCGGCLGLLIIIALIAAVAGAGGDTSEPTAQPVATTVAPPTTEDPTTEATPTEATPTEAATTSAAAETEAAVDPSNILTFEVETDGSTANVTYLGPNFQITQKSDVESGWSTTAEFDGDMDMIGVNMNAQLNGSGTVTCRIKNGAGEVLAENTSDGDYVMVSCNMPTNF